MAPIDPAAQFSEIADFGLRAMLLLGALSFVLTGLKTWFGAKWKGQAGEERLRRKLAGKYETLDDIYFPDPQNAEEWTQLDHLVRLKNCILVIETKNMSGKIIGSNKSATWTQYLGRTKSTFQNPLRQNYKHKKAVEAVTSASTPIRELVCFVGDAKFPKGVPDGVVLLSDLRAAIAKIEKEEGQLEPDSWTALRTAAVNSKEVAKEHIANLQRKHGSDNRSFVGKVTISIGIAVALYALFS